LKYENRFAAADKMNSSEQQICKLSIKINPATKGGIFASYLRD